MKLNIFGYEFTLIPESETLQAQGARTKKKQSWKKIKKVLDDMERRHVKYSEYQLQQQSGLSINTVKKYRGEIEEYREKIRVSLF
jgi:hypothetical protein